MVIIISDTFPTEDSNPNCNLCNDGIVIEQENQSDSCKRCCGTLKYAEQMYSAKKGVRSSGCVEIGLLYSTPSVK